MMEGMVNMEEEIKEIMKKKRVVCFAISKKPVDEDPTISIWKMEITCMSGDKTLQTYQYSNRQQKVFYSENYVFSVKECHVMHLLLFKSHVLRHGEQLQCILQYNDTLLVQTIKV